MCCASSSWRVTCIDLPRKGSKCTARPAATEGIAPRISRISRMKTLHTAFCIAIIRAIRAIRGKNLRETERLLQIAVQRGEPQPKELDARIHADGHGSRAPLHLCPSVSIRGKIFARLRDSDRLQRSAARRNRRNCTTDFTDGMDRKDLLTPTRQDAKTPRRRKLFAPLRLAALRLSSGCLPSGI